MPDSLTDGDLIVYVADDGDLASISYTGAWQHHVEADKDFDDPLNSTVSLPLELKASATVNFTGVAVVAVAGVPLTINSTAARFSPPNLTVTLDGNTPTKVTVPLSTDVPLFKAGPLNADLPHTLTITVDAQTDDFPFALDGIAYAAFRNQTKPPSQAVLPAGGNSSGLLQGLLPGEAGAQGKKEDGLPVGPIVGGVIGGAALLVIVSLVVWYLFIRPRRRGGRAFFYAPAKITDMLSGETADSKPEPYPLNLPSTTPTMSQYSSPIPQPHPTSFPHAGPASEVSSSHGPSDSVSGYGYGSSSNYGYGSSYSGGMASPPPGVDGAAHRRKAEMAGMLSVPAGPTTYHADSGIRFGGDGGGAGPSTEVVPELSEVPPSYSEK
ncbi:hypothetical protein OH77DRAFT_1434300 [Trametes cingulata]|nr:hypothetical protein OH77DRAFT_1434300 [Trametes cingulata]